MTSFWKHIYKGIATFALASGLASMSAPSAHAALGDDVSNIATISQDTASGQLVLNTNSAVFTIEARQTPSRVDFFRIAPAAPDAQIISLNGTDFSPSGDLVGPFLPIGAVTGFGKTAPVAVGPTALVPAETYISGEVMVVRVIDAGQNGDPSVIETVNLRISTDNGDEIVLRLYESSADSGEFFAFFASSADPSAQNDTIITAPQDTVLTATYIDVFDSSEVSVDTALIDPYGRVFDSFSGQLLDGVSVTVIDDSTGLPAAVTGIDGSAVYPSTVRTGEAVTDSNGTTYPAQPGIFFYPILPPGAYRLDVQAPEGYLYPSERQESDFLGLPNAPFAIDLSGSYGQTITLSTTGPINLDVPLDPNGDLIARKEASESTASVGDFISYTVELENAGLVSTPFTLQDTLPLGLRYISGSARLDGVQIGDPKISGDGRTLTFPESGVLAGETVQIRYVVSVGPGASEGQIVNTALALNRSGAALSNIAEAAIIIEEDLLKSRLTIIGRVAESACQPDQEWARSLADGKGVSGVRLYMETGRYVVTDADGLFHFEGVRPGTHVVQVDKATLPAGYDPVVCEENTRYAGSALSKFVDARGGTVWRANFYLKRNGSALDAQDEPNLPDESDQVFDHNWLNNQQDTEPHWAYPLIGSTPAGRSVNLGFVHGADQNIRLTLNDHPVSGVNYAGTEFSDNRNTALSRWTGVDIQRGKNTFIADVRDRSGNLLTKVEKTVWFVDEVHRARLVADRSILVADGRTRPVLALRLEDGAAHPIHQGRLVEINVADPYRLAQAAELEFENPAATAFSNVIGTRVSAEGIAYVELEPTLQSGRVRLSVKLHDGRIEDVDVWLQPEKREWVLVGLAEAEGLLSHVEGNNSRDLDEVMGDGRLAFFAKGVIRGDWLLTIAVDTAKRRGNADGELFDEIDPNAYYTLYGDRTWQNNDAESRYPVYIKLERDTFQALFGDFETDLTDTELGRYSRRLSGLKVDYESEILSVTAFASETNQSFAKDEIASDGTSGPYALRQAPLIRSSEVITIETRDRFRPDTLVGVQTLTRYTDYEIDYVTGELFFRHPVAAADAQFNPNVIVVDYETASAGDRSITAGGRAAVRMADGAVETGITAIREDGRSGAQGASTLIASDITIRLGEQTEIRAEAAASSAKTDLGKQSGNAWLVEATRRSENLSLTGYYREETEGYGLGQQSSASSAIRRVGAQLSAELGATDVAGGNDRSVRRIEAQTYREENLSVGTRRDVVDLALRQDSQTFGASVGLRAAAEDFNTLAAPRQSVLLTASLRKTFLDQGLTISAAHEEPIYSGGANDDDVTLFPGRTVLGVDKTLGRRATLSLRHEVTNGGDASGDNTVAGITWTPRSGTDVRVSADMITRDDARRIGATVGVDQTWQIDDRWSVGVGLARRANVDGSDIPLDVTPDAAIGPLEDGLRSPLVGDEDYTSGYFGAGYRGEHTAASGRIEIRDSASGNRVVTSLGGAREISEKLSFSAALRYQDEHNDQTADRETLDVRIGTAWRPRGEGIVVFNRFDIGHDKVEGQSQRTKVVNNLVLNTMLTERTQVSFYHGIKYVEAEFEGFKTSGFTHLAGTEIRHDITPKFDIGLAATWTSGEATHTSEWAFGPSLGFTPRDNFWVSFGWNVSGFEDRDFKAAEYTRSGPYIKLRAKFDQDSIKGLIHSLGLGGP